jgi:hypothetical protein
MRCPEGGAAKECWNQQLWRQAYGRISGCYTSYAGSQSGICDGVDTNSGLYCYKLDLHPFNSRPEIVTFCRNHDIALGVSFEPRPQ